MGWPGSEAFRLSLILPLAWGIPPPPHLPTCLITKSLPQPLSGRQEGTTAVSCSLTLPCLFYLQKNLGRNLQTNVYVKSKKVQNSHFPQWVLRAQSRYLSWKCMEQKAGWGRGWRREGRQPWPEWGYRPLNS